MATLSKDTVSFKDYYGRFLRQFTSDLLRLGREQVIGALLAVAILASQFYFGLIPAVQTRQSWVSILLPYFILILALCILSTLRAPVTIDRDRYNEIKKQTEEIDKLNGERSHLEELLHPLVSPDEERKRTLVADAIRRLKYQKSKEVLRRVWDCGKINTTCIWTGWGFQAPEANEVLMQGKASTLLILDSGMVEINPELRAAIDFVLKAEGL